MKGCVGWLWSRNVNLGGLYSATNRNKIMVRLNNGAASI